MVLWAYSFSSRAELALTKRYGFTILWGSDGAGTMRFIKEMLIAHDAGFDERTEYAFMFADLLGVPRADVVVPVRQGREGWELSVIDPRDAR